MQPRSPGEFVLRNFENGPLASNRFSQICPQVRITRRSNLLQSVFPSKAQYDFGEEKFSKIFRPKNY